MPDGHSPPTPLIVIAGPTGSGKSELALCVAEGFSGEIVNCDSLQIYRHFDIGTAKLTAAEMRAIPHHLIDIVDPDEVFTAGEYARRARLVLADIAARGRTPVIAGGTGFYLRALVEGLFPGPERDAGLRTRLAAREERCPGSLHRLLSRFDPPSAAAIHPNDVPKVMRALEVCLLSGRPISSMFGEGRDPLRGYRILKLGLNPDRETLYRRLDERCERMFAGGLIEEARRILDLGFPPGSKPFESHGYRQALQVLNGELNLREAVFYAQRNTRRYAKRQMTWFRRDPGIAWLKGFGHEPAIRKLALEKISLFFFRNQPNVFLGGA